MKNKSKKKVIYQETYFSGVLCSDKDQIKEIIDIATEIHLKAGARYNDGTEAITIQIHFKTDDKRP